MKRFRLHICSCIIVILLFIITLGGCSLLGVSKEFSVTPADGFQTEYVVGDEISLDKLKVVYDGKTLDFSEYELVKQATNDVALPGQLMYTEDTYVIKYNGNTSKESITVRFYQPLTKLELIRADGGLAEYYAGDDFVLDDWRVKAYYSDDKSVSVPLNSEMLGGLNGAMLLAAGEYTLSISLLNVTNDVAWTLNVDKKTQSKPELTVGYTDTTATARRTDGAEYKINDGSWTADYIFSGLSPNTDYTVYCRMAETDKLYASDVAVFSFTTLKSERVNTTAEIYDVTHNSFKVKYVDGLKVSAGTLQFTEGAGYYMFTGAAPNTTYKLTYWIASDATHYESERSSVDVKTKAIPASFSVKTSTYEYSGSRRTVLYSLTTSDGEVNLSADNFKITYKQNGAEVVPLHAGSYDVMLTYIGNEYDAADYNCTLVITPKPITVTAQQVESTYGDTEKPLVYSSVGLVDGDGLKGFLTREQGDNVGGYDIILGSVANSDYAITYIGAKYVISPKSATVAIGNKEKNYGEANPTFTLITSGLLDGDELAGYSFVCGATAESVVGRYEIDIVNYQDENYIFTVTKGTLTVNKRALTVTADAATATYGETPTLSYRTEGLIVGDKIDGKPECLGKHVGIWDVSVGTLTAGDNYDLRFIPSKLTINKKSLTVAIKQRYAKTYGEDNPPFEYVIDGFAYGDIEADLSGRIIIECLADKFSAVGEYVVSISGVSSADYDVTFVNNILSVGRKTVYVKADGKTQLYGNEAVELTYIPDGLINGDLLLGKLQRVAGENVGQYDILVGTLNNNNYSIVYTGAKYTISRAPLTVTVVSVSKRYGEDNPVDKYGYSAMGFKRGDTKAQLDETALQYVTSVDKSTKAGTYAITLTGLTAANYDVSVIAGIFEVTESSIEITIAESYLNVTYDAAAKPVVANATEAGDFSFRYEYNGQNVPPTAAGNYDVKVIFEGDGNYAATSKYFTMLISPRPIKVMADAKNPFYGDSASLTYTYDKTDLLGNQFTGSLTRETGDDVGAYGILQGTLQLSNHVITFVSASYVINPRTLTVRVIDDQKQYGDDNPTFDYASEGLMGGDLITGEAAYRTSVEKFSSVAAYAVSVSGLTAGKNYTIKYADGTLTVIKRDVNIVFGANTFVYDGTEKHIDASLTGLVNADTVIIYFDKTVISAGDYSVRASIVSDNYNLIGSVTATVKVEKAEQVISVEKTTFGYDGNAHSIVATLTSGDGAISYIGNSFTEKGNYTVTVTADESANYNKKTVNISVKVIAASTVITSLNDISVNYGDGLTDNLIVGTAKNEYGTVVAGQFALKNQGLKPTVAQSGLYAVVFTPLDGNYEASEANVNVNVKKIDVIVTAYGAGKAVGQSDPSFKYETTGLINGDTLNILLSRAAGEAVGEYEYTLGDSTADNYNLLLSGNEKFHIYGQLVSFNYGDAFKYRLGTVGTVTLDVNLAEGVDVGTLKFVSSTEIGNATVSVTGKTATVSGSGLVKLSAMVDGCYDTVFDQYIFEVVEGGKNVTALAAMSSAGNVILHSDVEVTTSGFSVGEGSSLYGNGYTVNASNINPASNYQSVVTLSGLLENLTIIGRYADSAYNSDNVAANNYKTVQTVYIYKNAVIRNCYISGGRYAVRTGGVQEALIENTTIANALFNIAVMATGGKEKLTLKNVDIVEKPTNNSGEGVGAGIVFTEDKYPKNFTLRLEGDVNFHCFISKSDISSMASDYQSVLNALWGSAAEFKYTIGGTEYINAAIAHVKADNDDFILECSDDCNVKGGLDSLEKSVSVLGTNYTGKMYSFKKGVLTDLEVNKLFAVPVSKADSYSALKPTVVKGYNEAENVTVANGAYYEFSRTAAKFTKYGQSLSYTTSILQTSTSVGNYSATAAAYLLEQGTYEITYTVFDRFENVYFTYVTKVSVTDNTPPPIIVFTYGDGKGSGTAADPFKWQGKTVGTTFDNDYDCLIDLYMGVQAYDSRGNVLPLTSFKITYGSSSWSNSSSGVYSYKSNNMDGNQAYTSASGIKFIYTVSDVYGKTTTAERYVKVTDWCKFGNSPDNGIAPSASRVTDGYELGTTNVGEVLMMGKGTLVICDGQNVYTEASRTATGTLTNTSENHTYTYDDGVFLLTHTGTAHITINFNYTLNVNGYSVTSATTFAIDTEYSITCVASAFKSNLDGKVNDAVAAAIEKKQSEFTTAGFTRTIFNASGVPDVQI